jgi:hypothetical protein
MLCRLIDATTDGGIHSGFSAAAVTSCAPRREKSLRTAQSVTTLAARPAERPRQPDSRSARVAAR